MDEAGTTARIFETTSREVKTIGLRQLRASWTGDAIIFDSPRPRRFAFIAACFFAMAVILAPTTCLVYRSRRSKTSPRAGMTLVELLMAIAMIGVLLGILLPTVQYTRESSRAAQCRNNLRQLGVALHNYETQFHCFRRR